MLWLGLARHGVAKRGLAGSGRELATVDWVFIEYLFECYGEAGLVRSGEAWHGKARANVADRGLATVSLPMQQCIK